MLGIVRGVLVDVHCVYFLLFCLGGERGGASSPSGGLNIKNINGG